MGQNSLKILVVDDSEEIRELVTFFLQANMECEIVTANSSRKALEIFKKDPTFNLILSDLHMPDGHGIDLVRYFDKNDSQMPIVILSGEATNKFPELKTRKHLTWIAKPFSDDELIAAVQSQIGDYAAANKGTAQIEMGAYIPVKLDLLRMIRKVQTPLFIKINNSKFIKMTPEESIFNQDQYQKFKHKGVEYLYIESFQTEKFICEFRKNTLSQEAWKQASANEAQGFINQNIDLMRNISNQLGWREELLKLAQENIQRVLHLVSQEKQLNLLVQKFLHIEKFGFADHCTLSALVATALAEKLGVGTPENFRLLTFAALFHDMTLSDEQYDNKSKFIKNIRRGEHLHLKDAKEVFAHSAKAAAMVKNWDFCPSGVDIVIMNHHELADGTGFPMGRQAEQLDLLSVIFIVAEEFAQFVIDASGLPTIEGYTQATKDKYGKNPFKEVHKILIDSFAKKMAA